jgi:hypothetical protein
MTRRVLIDRLFVTAARACAALDRAILAIVVSPFLLAPCWPTLGGASCPAFKFFYGEVAANRLLL